MLRNWRYVTCRLVRTQGTDVVRPQPWRISLWVRSDLARTTQHIDHGCGHGIRYAVKGSHGSVAGACTNSPKKAYISPWRKNCQASGVRLRLHLGACVVAIANRSLAFPAKTVNTLASMHCTSSVTATASPSCRGVVREARYGTCPRRAALGLLPSRLRPAHAGVSHISDSASSSCGRTSSSNH